MSRETRTLFVSNVGCTFQAKEKNRRSDSQGAAKAILNGQAVYLPFFMPPPLWPPPFIAGLPDLGDTNLLFLRKGYEKQAVENKHA